MNDESRSIFDLVAWQRAMDLVEKAYDAIKSLPPEEKYALSDQIRRAAVSIPANIAEGHDRHHAREFVQYLGVAKGSLAELETLFLVCQRVGYLSQGRVDTLREVISGVRRPLHGLIQKMRQPLILRPTRIRQAPLSHVPE